MPSYDPIPSVWGPSSWGYSWWGPVSPVSVSGRIASYLTGRGAPNVTTHTVSGQARIISASTLALTREISVEGQGRIMGASTLAGLVRTETVAAKGEIVGSCYIEIPNNRFLPTQAVPTRDRSGQGAGSRYVSSTLVWALCPRCSFRYRLSEMREEIFDERLTGRSVCPECYDKDDPHLQLSRIDLTDTGLVENPLPHPQRQSVCYSTDPRAAGWDSPLLAVWGAFTVGAVTPPAPPVGPGWELAALSGSMAAYRKGVRNAKW